MKLKRLLASLLVLCLTLTLLPSRVQAAETAETNVDNSSMTVEGTNGFGNLLSTEIAESQSEEAASGCQAGYSVTELTFDGSTATVTYAALEEAILVVAVYTEDGLQMLASGKTTVSPDVTQATVAIEGDVPEYFYAGAFLMDREDYVPLCENYSTPMYTREMQELLTSTTDDYDPSLVYNLDDDKTTNFAVFAEDTVIVREQAGVNTITGADDTNRVYVIENADEAITSLQQGDVLAYPYGEGQILIVKVDTITLDGTTATITGTDLEMDEAFRAVKVEAQTAAYELTPSSGEGITYVGSTPQARNADPSIEDGLSSTFEIKLKKCGDDGKEVEINGSLTLGITTSVACYITESYHMVELKFSFSQAYTVTASGKYQLKDGIPISEFTIHALVGVDVSITPKLMLEFSGALTAEYSYTASIGAYIEYDGNEWDAGVIVEQPSKAFDFRLEGTVFLGVSLEPSLEIMDGMLATIKLEGKLGVELKGTANTIGWEEDPSEIHDCSICIDGDLSLVYSLEPSITLLNSDKLTLKAKWLDIKMKYLDFYWSKDRDEFHLGTCPYVSYKVTIAAFDENYSVLADTPIRLSDGTVHTTSKHGAAVVYLPNGTYTAGILSNDITASAEFTVADNSQKVLLMPTAPEPEFGFPGDVGSEIIPDYGAVMDFGTCGDGVSWLLTEGGSLIISGTGDMYNFTQYNIPWNRYWSTITSVQILTGVTTIGNYAFYYHSNITTVAIPPTVTRIGESAFRFCSSLTEVYIPASVTNIAEKAFLYCDALQQFRVDPQNARYCNDAAGIMFNKEMTWLIQAPCGIVGDYTVPESVTTIEYGAFARCNQLTGIVIPESVTLMRNCIFEDCSALSSAVINGRISWIPLGTFNGCTALTTITVPDGVTHIAENAFAGCVNLTEVILPEGLNGIWDRAFYYCENLAIIDLPASVTTIREEAFYMCSALTEVTLPKKLTNIRARAFGGCSSLNKITFMGDAPDIANYYSYTFGSVTATCYYPADNPTWTSDVMLDYGGTLTWVPYTLDEDGSMVINEAAATTATTDGDAMTEDTAPVLPTSFTDDLIIDEQPTDEMTPDAVYGGEYATEITDTYTLKTATFSGLVPGAEYVMLAMVSIETEDILAADNLLGILQATAGTDGTLVFQYVQRVDTDVSYVVACGASNKNLADAEITFPEMTADGTLQVVNPTVTYGGKTLTEGVDYEIIGTVDFTDPGEYTCQIRGIHNYTGLVTCTYTVTKNPVLFGDLTGDGEVDIFDANLIVAFYNGTADLTADQQTAADVNGDGDVDIFDANLVVSYYNGTIAAFPVEE